MATDLVEAGATYLVTGGAGFIGSNLVDRLVEGGARVRVLDDFSTGRRENLEGVADRIELIEGSVTDPAACDEACRGAHYVLHQAAVPSVQRSVADPVTSHETNATGTLRMLEAARKHDVRRFVLAGSSSVYGDTPELPKVETMTPTPQSPYAAAKLAAENYARVYAGVYGLPTVVLRYFNVFGPRQDPASQYSAAIPIFITHALEGRAPTINGDGEQTRDFTYVENVVRANLLACRAEESAVSGDVFNVACGQRTSVNELWETIRGIVGAGVEAEHGPGRPGEVRDSVAGLGKAQESLGYEVDVSQVEGLERTIAWFSERTDPASTTDVPG